MPDSLPPAKSSTGPAGNLLLLSLLEPLIRRGDSTTPPPTSAIRLSTRHSQAMCISTTKPGDNLWSPVDQARNLGQFHLLLVEHVLQFHSAQSQAISASKRLQLAQLTSRASPPRMVRQFVQGLVDCIGRSATFARRATVPCAGQTHSRGQVATVPDAIEDVDSGKARTLEVREGTDADISASGAGGFTGHQSFLHLRAASCAPISAAGQFHPSGTASASVSVREVDYGDRKTFHARRDLLLRHQQKLHSSTDCCVSFHETDGVSTQDASTRHGRAWVW
ncbi:hypothetical protein AYL99_11735 [Fonsecaea erecta]|uniref:Uncharacterized protein n=1 Tax=Fonsecaea erecta TaxID=1367422 RepID=A0A178Z352_9EURO|nr:hypothetical protein AYL99_11735 [Fonsecaea erecta]OAP54200.1 hypothetical protein AYL99_11735 [Fonsecaea erecta]